MNPREELVRKMVLAGKSDEEITSALAAFDAQGTPAAAERPGILSRVGSAISGGVNAINKRVADGLGPSFQQEDIGRGARGVLQMAQGAAMGGVDELAGVTNALFHPWKPIEAYKEGSAAVRGEDLKGQKEAGKFGSLALRAAGGAMVPAGAMGELAQARVPIARNAGKLLRGLTELASGVVPAAAVGTVGGALEAEPGKRAVGGMIGGATGTALGALLTAAPMVGRSIRDYFGLDRGGTARRRVSESLNTIMERQGRPDDVMTGDLMDERNAPNALRYAREQREAPGTFARGKRLMDRSPETQQLAGEVANSSIPSERSLGRLAARREQAQNSHLARDLSDAVGAQPNVSAEVVRDTRNAGLQQFEDAFYPQLFETFPDPVNTPAAQEVFELGRAELPRYVDAIRRNQALRSEPLDELLGTIGNTATPTLEGMHRLKTQVGSALRNMDASAAAGNLSDEANALRGSLATYQDRLRDALQSAPMTDPGSGMTAGDLYALAQQRGAQTRGQVGALESGLDLAGDGMRGYTAGQALQEAATTPGGEAALRQGVATGVRNASTAKNANNEGFLKRIAQTQDTREAVDALAPTRGQATLFGKRMRDRIAMAETNKLQTGAKTGAKEILKGSRARGTALGLGEAGVLGSAAMGNPSGAAKGIRLAGGALAAKGLEGFRGGATSEAADQLRDLLSRGSGDMNIPSIYFDLLMANARLQQQRAIDAARRGAVIGTASGTLWKNH